MEIEDLLNAAGSVLGGRDGKEQGGSGGEQDRHQRQVTPTERLEPYGHTRDS